jgi:hypothetical protein
MVEEEIRADSDGDGRNLLAAAYASQCSYSCRLLHIQNMVKAMLDDNHDFAARVAFFKIAESAGDEGERVGAVDDRSDLP